MPPKAERYSAKPSVDESKVTLVSTLMGFSPPFLVMMFTTPPMASDPYNTEAGPLMTSMRSMRLGSMSRAAPSMDFCSEIFCPSMSTSTRCPLSPRICTRLAPGTERSNTSTPGTSRRASATLMAGLRFRSSWSTTAADEGTSFRSCSVRVAVTTTSRVRAGCSSASAVVSSARAAAGDSSSTVAAASNRRTAPRVRRAGMCPWAVFSRPGAMSSLTMVVPPRSRGSDS